MSRKLIYWKTVKSEKSPWATFTIVPETELEESIYLDEQIQVIKDLGFSYKVLEITETLIEGQE
jgi:uncharacterized protein YqgV (UPF0045/DUF77 family)